MAVASAAPYECSRASKRSAEGGGCSACAEKRWALCRCGDLRQLAVAPDGRVLALDRDPEAVARGAQKVAAHGGRLMLFQTPFSGFTAALDHFGLGAPNGALFDIGVSSRQLDEGRRGFSFMHDGPLNMRMDGGQGVEAGEETAPTAADLVNMLEVGELADLIWRYGEERHARRIARAVVAQRAERPFHTTRELAELLEKVVPAPRRGRKGQVIKKIHPATRTFQALRMAVNSELDELRQGLDAAMKGMAVGGRIAVISFHSLEDRIVKRRFREAAQPSYDPRFPMAPMPSPTLRLITRKPIRPGEAECAANPRARSARLRVAERLPVGAGDQEVRLS